jgi:hypothetical protein
LSCAVAPEQTSRTATDAEANSQVSQDPFEIRDRQTVFVRGSESRTARDYCPRERLATKQPGRELACPGATTRAKDATLPVSRIGSEIPLGTCFSLQHFQHLSPSHHVCNEASVPHRGLRGMAHRRGCRCLKRHSSATGSSEPGNVTNPGRELFDASRRREVH